MNMQSDAMSCPDWCISDHSLQYHPEDHIHIGDGISVPIVRQVRKEQRGIWRWIDVSVGMDIAFEMPVGQSTPHVALATEDGCMEVRITLESAQRVARAIDELLTEHLFKDARGSNPPDDRR